MIERYDFVVSSNDVNVKISDTGLWVFHNDVKRVFKENGRVARHLAVVHNCDPKSPHCNLCNFVDKYKDYKDA
jgi:hypothetical protein